MVCLPYFRSRRQTRAHHRQKWDDTKHDTKHNKKYIYATYSHQYESQELCCTHFWLSLQGVQSILRLNYNVEQTNQLNNHEKDITKRNYI